MEYIVNGKKVEYFYMTEKNDKKIIEFSEIFNIIEARTVSIMEKLKENDLEIIHIEKDFKHDIIMILFKDINQVHGVLHVLNIPPGCYEINDEDENLKIITIDIPILKEKMKL